MSQGTLQGPPALIDVTIELLRKSHDSWLPADDGAISLGDYIALRCWNLGDYEVSAAVFLRTMPGELKAAIQGTQGLWPNVQVEFGTAPDQPIMVGEEDIEIVLAVAASGEVIQELLEFPWIEQSFESAGMTLIGLPLEVRPSERAVSDGDLKDLLELADNGEFTMAAYALQALTLLQPPHLTRTRVSRLIRKYLRVPLLIHRPWLISIAANLGDAPLRRHLRAIATDSDDPHRHDAKAALGEVGDASGLDTLAAVLQGGAKERAHAARLIATRHPDFDVSAIAEETQDGPFAFWIAMAAARQGSFTAIQQHVTEADDIGFQRVVGDDINMFYAIRDIRPLPPGMRDYIQRELRQHQLAESVKDFYEALLRQADAPALHEGIRTVPAYCVDKIRDRLEELPGITQLASFTAEGNGWEQASNLAPAYRGVLLAELLRKAVTQLTPLAAATTVQRLITGWMRRPWYPYLEGLLSVVQELESIGADSVLAGMELQVAWLLSRAPIPSLLRLVSGRVMAGRGSAAEMRALANAIVTHWDSIPPPPMADITRAPQMIQPILHAEDRPWHDTRAWLEDKSIKDGIWSVTIMLTIGPGDEALADQQADVPGDAESPGEVEDFGELIVVPRAPDCTIVPSAAEIRFPSERQTVSATFEITTEQDSLQLLISIYQRQPTMLLQELKGVIELATDKGEQ